MQCPHCLQHFHGNWSYKAIAKDTDAPGWAIAFIMCAACQRLIIELGQAQLVESQAGLVVAGGGLAFTRLIHPKGISRFPLPPEVPKEFGTDYLEACQVLHDSEKASAALSRRCLQHLLREKAGIKSDDLAREIQQVLDSRQLPSHLADDLDAVRNVGNFAAHPLKTTNTGEIVEVEPHEAEWLLNVLEGLFDFYFVRPAKAKAKRDALNAKLQSMGKPPMRN
jgi:hypothetical protein